MSSIVLVLYIEEPVLNEIPNEIKIVMMKIQCVYVSFLSIHFTFENAFLK